MCCSGTMQIQTEKDVAHPSFTLNYSVGQEKIVTTALCSAMNSNQSGGIRP